MLNIFKKREDGADTQGKSGANLIKRRRIAIIGTILIGLLFTYLVLTDMYTSILDKYRQDMVAAVNFGKIQYGNNIQKNDIYFASNREAMEDITGFTAFVYEENGYSSAIRDGLVNDVGEFCTYYFFRGSINQTQKTVTGYMNHESRDSMFSFPEISDEELYKLLTEGYMKRSDGNYFTSAPVSNQGYVILGWGLEDVLKEQSILSDYSDKQEVSVFRLDIESGIIEDATDRELVGVDCTETIKKYNLEDLVSLASNIADMEDGSRAYIVTDMADGQLYCAFIKLDEIMPDIFRSCCLPVVLGWMFLILTLIYVLRFARRQYENDDQIEYFNLFGRIHVDKMLMQHVVSIVGFAVILIIASMLYVQTLINYSDQNVKANHNLQTLDALIAMNDENRELLKNDYAEVRSILIQDISKYYMRYPEQLSDDSINRLKNKMKHTDSIAFYNTSGDVKFDTQDAAGYTLSKDERLGEYKCWDIINGVTDSISYTDSADYTRVYVASRRQDKPGLIRISQSAPYFSEFDNLTAIDRSVLSAYFGTSAKAYIVDGDSKTLYWVGNNEQQVVKKNNTLTDAMLQNGYAGITRIDGRRYYINTRNDDATSYVLISAKPLAELFGMYNIRVIFIIIGTFLLEQILAIMLGAHVFKGSTQHKMEIIRNGFIRQSLDEQMMDEKFRKVIRNMFVATCIMIVLLLIFDSMYGKTSLLNYLFASQWSKGLNMFSITMILILAAIAIVGGGVLQALIVFFTKNMGPRGMTIGRMSSSIIRFIVLLIILVNILLDLGVNSGTLLTGAGVFGVAFSLFAQQTLNDFLSGFFIVFEGTFNIGDWLTVGEFRGQVIEIGIRTTKVAIGGDIRIINNSELKQVTVMAHNGTGARVFVDIAYREDIDAVIKLIEGSTEIYKREMPYMLEGPYVDGVVNLGDSGVTLRIWALADQEKVRAVERDVLRITKAILDENNIEIPFNQVTIHTADD